jgi:hypothetical protein
MKREPHVRFCEGLGCNSLGLLTYGYGFLDMGIGRFWTGIINNRPEQSTYIAQKSVLRSGASARNLLMSTT